MYTAEYNHSGTWKPSQLVSRSESFRHIQREVSITAYEDYWRILSDGTVVAEWTPGDGWRYWRSAEEIIEWYNNADWRLCREFHVYMEKYPRSHGKDFCFATHMRDCDDFISNYYMYSDHANAYLDSISACLPEGALPPGKQTTQRESVMNTRKAIADLTKNDIGKLYVEDKFDNAVFIEAECRVNKKIWTRADWEALNAAVRWAGGWDNKKEEAVRTFTPEV